MSHLDHPAVRRVQAALREKGSRAEVIELGTTAGRDRKRSSTGSSQQSTKETECFDR